MSSKIETGLLQAFVAKSPVHKVSYSPAQCRNTPAKISTDQGSREQSRRIVHCELSGLEDVVINDFIQHDLIADGYFQEGPKNVLPSSLTR
jgi:hypothetical protein